MAKTIQDLIKAFRSETVTPEDVADTLELLNDPELVKAIKEAASKQGDDEDPEEDAVVAADAKPQAKPAAAKPVAEDEEEDLDEDDEEGGDDEDLDDEDEDAEGEGEDEEGEEDEEDEAEGKVKKGIALDPEFKQAFDSAPSVGDQAGPLGVGDACQECGKSASTDDKYCRECGTKLTAVGAAGDRVRAKDANKGKTGDDTAWDIQPTDALGNDAEADTDRAKGEAAPADYRHTGVNDDTKEAAKDNIAGANKVKDDAKGAKDTGREGTVRKSASDDEDVWDIDLWVSEGDLVKSLTDEEEKEIAYNALPHLQAMATHYDRMAKSLSEVVDRVSDSVQALADRQEFIAKKVGTLERRIVKSLEKSLIASMESALEEAIALVDSVETQASDEPVEKSLPAQAEPEAVEETVTETPAAAPVETPAEPVAQETATEPQQVDVAQQIYKSIADKLQAVVLQQQALASRQAELQEAVARTPEQKHQPIRKSATEIAVASGQTGMTKREGLALLRKAFQSKLIEEDVYSQANLALDQAGKLNITYEEVLQKVAPEVWKTYVDLKQGA